MYGCEGGVSAGCGNKSRNGVRQKCIDGEHCVSEGCSNKSRNSIRGVWMVKVVYLYLQVAVTIVSD